MKLNSVDLRPIWERANARNLGPAPYPVVMAAARLAGNRATHVLAEADVNDGGTRWRLLWLTDSTLGVVDASSEVGDWCSDNQGRVRDPEVKATIRPLADCRRVTYEQSREYFTEFGQLSSFEAQTEVTLHFDDCQVELARGSWKYSDAGKLEEFQSAVVELWEELQIR